LRKYLSFLCNSVVASPNVNCGFYVIDTTKLKSADFSASCCFYCINKQNVFRILLGNINRE
jgi:hypothetical protein